MTAEQLLATEPTRSPRPSRNGPGRAHPLQLRGRRPPLGGGRAALLRDAVQPALPQTRDLFPVNMEVQRSRLLRALVHVVQMVDRPDELVPFLEQLGRDHRKFGVLAEHYDAVGDRAAQRRRGVRRAGLDPARSSRRGPTPTARSPRRCGRRRAPSAGRPPGWAGSSGTAGSAGTSRSSTVATSEPIPYRAGQYVSVETPQRPRLWRYLSPANAPREDGRAGVPRPRGAAAAG